MILRVSIIIPAYAGRTPASVSLDSEPTRTGIHAGIIVIVACPTYAPGMDAALRMIPLSR